ncbi:hypothetical protein N7509_009961 [Penicillium cosmopolitanum]|uniref:Uncharacterized protein n=1 Tax=Penicillium cosmopolitanum TaxID=1131564 RepID=A0A9W9VQJ5_9EURO|nr:uncharacterized protein N7509_009961 [Penicillium cosmopolitanum]KAJ5387420.1 hypothetical protein N7509_009961 [Penicillium cosmopolitanum]
MSAAMGGGGQPSANTLASVGHGKRIIGNTTVTASFKKNQVLGARDLHQELAAKFWPELPGGIDNGQLKPLDFKVIEGLDAVKVNNLLDDYHDGRAVTKTHVHPDHRGSIFKRRILSQLI